VGCGSLYGSYGDGYIPFNAVIDPTGVLRYSDSGFSSTALHAVIGQYMVLDHPAFSIEAIAVDDSDGDGRPESGESASLAITLRNSPIAVDAWNLTLALNCDDPALSWSVVDATLGGLDAGASGVFAPQLVFEVADPVAPHWATLELTVHAEYADGVWEQSFSRDLRIGRPDLLVVDSDGSADDNETFAVNALASLGVQCDVWSVPDSGELPSAEALAYERLVWLGGGDTADLSAGERAVLAEFLERGGLLVLSTQYGGNGPAAAPFLAEWFDVSVEEPDNGSVFLTNGNDADPWFDHIDFVLTGSAGANNLADPDRLALGPDAHLLCSWAQGAGGPAACWSSGPNWRAIYCGFPIEAMRTHGSIPESVTLATFFTRVFAFDAGLSTPPAPVVASLSYQDGQLWLSWTNSPEATSYRVYSLDAPWGGAETLVGETTETGMPLPAAGAAGLFTVRAQR